jgi:hypothetical protein
MNRDRAKLAKVLRQVAEAAGLNGLPPDDVALAESLSLSLLGDDHGPSQSDVISSVIDALSVKLLTNELRDESVLVRELRRLLEEEERRTYALERLTQQQAESLEKFEVELAHQQSLLAAARTRRSGVSGDTGPDPRSEEEISRLLRLVEEAERARDLVREKLNSTEEQLQGLAVRAEEQRSAADVAQKSLAARNSLAADNLKLKQELERVQARLNAAEAKSSEVRRPEALDLAPGIPGWVTQALEQAAKMPLANYGAILMKSRSAIEQAIEWKWNESGGGFTNAPTQRLEELQTRNVVTFDALMLTKTIYKFLSRRIHDEVDATPADAAFAVAAAKRAIELIAKV